MRAFQLFVLLLSLTWINVLGHSKDPTCVCTNPIEGDQIEDITKLLGPHSTELNRPTGFLKGQVVGGSAGSTLVKSDLAISVPDLTQDSRKWTISFLDGCSSRDFVENGVFSAFGRFNEAENTFTPTPCFNDAEGGCEECEFSPGNFLEENTHLQGRIVLDDAFIVGSSFNIIVEDYFSTVTDALPRLLRVQYSGDAVCRAIMLSAGQNTIIHGRLRKNNGEPFLEVTDACGVQFFSQSTINQEWWRRRSQLMTCATCSPTTQFRDSVRVMGRITAIKPAENGDLLQIAIERRCDELEQSSCEVLVERSNCAYGIYRDENGSLRTGFRIQVDLSEQTIGGRATLVAETCGLFPLESGDVGVCDDCSECGSLSDRLSPEGGRFKGALRGTIVNVDHNKYGNFFKVTVLVVDSTDNNISEGTEQTIVLPASCSTQRILDLPDNDNRQHAFIFYRDGSKIVMTDCGFIEGVTSAQWTMIERLCGQCGDNNVVASDVVRGTVISMGCECDPNFIRVEVLVRDLCINGVSYFSPTISLLLPQDACQDFTVCEGRDFDFFVAQIDGEYIIQRVSESTQTWDACACFNEQCGGEPDAASVPIPVALNGPLPQTYGHCGGAEVPIIYSDCARQRIESLIANGNYFVYGRFFNGAYHVDRCDIRPVEGDPVLEELFEILYGCQCADATITPIDGQATRILVRKGGNNDKVINVETCETEPFTIASCFEETAQVAGTKYYVYTDENMPLIPIPQGTAMEILRRCNTCGQCSNSAAVRSTFKGRVVDLSQESCSAVVYNCNSQELIEYSTENCNGNSITENAIVKITSVDDVVCSIESTQMTCDICKAQGVTKPTDSDPLFAVVGENTVVPVPNPQGFRFQVTQVPASDKGKFVRFSRDSLGPLYSCANIVQNNCIRFLKKQREFGLPSEEVLGYVVGVTNGNVMMRFVWKENMSSVSDKYKFISKDITLKSNQLQGTIFPFLERGTIVKAKPSASESSEKEKGKESDKGKENDVVFCTNDASLLCDQQPTITNFLRNPTPFEGQVFNLADHVEDILSGTKKEDVRDSIKTALNGRNVIKFTSGDSTYYFLDTHQVLQASSKGKVYFTIHPNHLAETCKYKKIDKSNYGEAVLCILRQPLNPCHIIPVVDSCASVGTTVRFSAADDLRINDVCGDVAALDTITSVTIKKNPTKSPLNAMIQNGVLQIGCGSCTSGVCSQACGNTALTPVEGVATDIGPRTARIVPLDGENPLVVRDYLRCENSFGFEELRQFRLQSIQGNSYLIGACAAGGRESLCIEGSTVCDVAYNTVNWGIHEEDFVIVRGLFTQDKKGRYHIQPVEGSRCAASFTIQVDFGGPCVLPYLLLNTEYYFKLLYREGQNYLLQPGYFMLATQDVAGDIEDLCSFCGTSSPCDLARYDARFGTQIRVLNGETLGEKFTSNACAGKTAGRSVVPALRVGTERFRAYCGPTIPLAEYCANVAENGECACSNMIELFVGVESDCLRTEGQLCVERVGYVVGLSQVAPTEVPYKVLLRSAAGIEPVSGIVRVRGTIVDNAIDVCSIIPAEAPPCDDCSNVSVQDFIAEDGRRKAFIVSALELQDLFDIESSCFTLNDPDTCGTKGNKVFVRNFVCGLFELLDPQVGISTAEYYLLIVRRVPGGYELESICNAESVPDVNLEALGEICENCITENCATLQEEISAGAIVVRGQYNFEAGENGAGRLTIRVFDECSTEVSVKQRIVIENFTPLECQNLGECGRKTFVLDRIGDTYTIRPCGIREYNDYIQDCACNDCDATLNLVEDIIIFGRIQSGGQIAKTGQSYIDVIVEDQCRESNIIVERETRIFLPSSVCNGELLTRTNVDLMFIARAEGKRLILRSCGVREPDPNVLEQCNGNCITSCVEDSNDLANSIYVGGRVLAIFPRGEYDIVKFVVDASCDTLEPGTIIFVRAYRTRCAAYQLAVRETGWNSPPIGLRIVQEGEGSNAYYRTTNCITDSFDPSQCNDSCMCNVPLRVADARKAPNIISVKGSITQIIPSANQLVIVVEQICEGEGSFTSLIVSLSDCNAAGIDFQLGDVYVFTGELRKQSIQVQGGAGTALVLFVQPCGIEPPTDENYPDPQCSCDGVDLSDVLAEESPVIVRGKITRVLPDNRYDIQVLQNCLNKRKFTTLTVQLLGCSAVELGENPVGRILMFVGYLGYDAARTSSGSDGLLLVPSCGVREVDPNVCVPDSSCEANAEELISNADAVIYGRVKRIYNCANGICRADLTLIKVHASSVSEWECSKIKYYIRESFRSQNILNKDRVILLKNVDNNVGFKYLIDTCGILDMDWRTAFEIADRVNCAQIQQTDKGYCGCARYIRPVCALNASGNVVRYDNACLARCAGAEPVCTCARNCKYCKEHCVPVQPYSE